MVTIQNESLRVEIKPKGAELNQLFHKQNGFDYLWSGDAAVWGKKSPVLFPIVGTLKQGKFFYQGASYALGRHGFARDLDFTLKNQGSSQATFVLQQSSVTKENFPFDFVFEIHYEVISNRLEVTYRIENSGSSTMYFSVGAHPAFKVPLTEDTTYEDYELQFNRTETADRWPISKDGLIESKSIPVLQQTNWLPLSKELFMKDALVFKQLKSDEVTLRSQKVPYGVRFQFDGFPYLGLWAAPGADFLCIEPWCGIADSVDADQQLEHKEGMIALAAGDHFSRTWKVSLF